ncbi:hypothetical protein B0I35DRAFT_441007 [Stachybotrys elegans]|uniref:Uncharacterized protein n=1 Tax=Stachybotrys elegans TaxID=80388 RepID=A0A8K0SLC5_9HYPO|nr:hypothetical protein B0I35DRAFT_441007 [Stachybotrys elegans]
MATQVQAAFFETTYAIVSVIGLNNVFVGLIIAGIVGEFSVVLLVPIITSAGCALGNGLGYYAWGSNYPVVNRAVAAAFSNFMWMVQEAGLPFYGYAILAPVLCGIERVIFLTIFWGLVVVIFFFRIAVLVLDTRYVIINDPSPDHLALHTALVNRLHLAYFLPIAMAETVSAVFLLMRFSRTLRASKSGGLGGGGRLYRYLMRSTEIRLASLAFIGITRAISFSFRVEGSSRVEGPYPLAGQIDRFMYILGCLFPFIMLYVCPSNFDTLTFYKWPKPANS